MYQRPLYLALLLIFVTDSTRLWAQAFVPGTTYYGVNKYTEYHPGTLPIIFSAPHGGPLTPANIPDRTCNSPTVVTDSNTSDLAMQMDSACLKAFGCHAHIIICNLKRTKLDCNRDVVNGTCGDLNATQAWNEFHGFIDTAVLDVMKKYGGGLYIDLHGQGHTIQRLELGYLITATDLNLADNALNTSTNDSTFSMRNLLATHPSALTVSKIIRGPTAIGTQLAARGYPSVPSQQDPFPALADPYFDGGYNTNRYGSDNGGKIDALQIESNFTGVRDTPQNRKNFADTLISVIHTFLNTYDQFSPLNLGTCNAILTSTDIRQQTDPELIVFPNPSHGLVNLSFSALQEQVHIVLTDMSGHTVSSLHVLNGMQMTLPIEHLSPGFYLLNIQSNTGIYNRKILVLPE
jgi:N-formylglutamate amidohydrolase